MPLDLLVIFIFGISAFISAAFIRGDGRVWALMIGSIVAIYWLQPDLPIRFSPFILQTVTVALTIGTWGLTQLGHDEKYRRQTSRENRLSLLAICTVLLILTINRYLAIEYRLLDYRPPPTLLVAGVIALLFILSLLALRVFSKLNKRNLLTAAIVFIIILFIILKTEPLATQLSFYWRSATGQDAALASFTDLAWLGFSYVAFRLIHTLRDGQTGNLPQFTLREYIIYVLFPPSYIAGPIDRVERFIGDLRLVPDMKGLDSSRFWQGGQRIFIGMFKKFIIADALAQGMSLTPLNAEQATSTLGLWVLLYGYAFRLFFDFSGYTDIAIGLGILFGIKLPENFNRPYLTTNITRFWQSWHITLSNWVRFYVFSPLSRTLLRRKPRPSPTLIVLVSQLTTMIVIGLWHGVTWNFFIWGIWHGIALFAHKQWSDRTRKWYRGLKGKPVQMRAWTGFSWFLTFNYVVLGWVWFLMPSVQSALDAYRGLFGIFN